MNVAACSLVRPCARARARGNTFLIAAFAIAASCLSTLRTTEASAATFYVDGSNPACDNAGPGTEAVPYCTITAAQAAHSGAGVTIAVKPGTYNEVITVSKPGATGSPYVFQALGPGVVVNGRFSMSSRPWVTIDGFTINAAGAGTGLMVGSSSNAVITHNTVLDASGPSNYGIYASYASNLLIAGNTIADGANHGIVIRSVANSVVEDNVSHHNDAGFLFKIDGSATSNNVIRRNRAYANRTTGFYYQSGADDNLAIQNLAWSNGDHGIQHSGSHGNRHIGEVVWGNGDDGISVRSGSTGNSLFNCIVENNGLAAIAYEIFVDSTSTAGWSSDDNVIWNSYARPFKFGNTAYGNVQFFTAATGNDSRTRNQYPMLLDPANGDFRLIQGSPAIDCANAALPDWSSTDITGHAPADESGAPNMGLGPIDFADRGAFEFAPVGSPPVALVQSRPATSAPAQDYVIDASDSYDLDGPIRWYSYTFGDGAVSFLSPNPSATHTYAPGNWTATVTVVGASGLVSSGSTSFTAGSTTDAIGSTASTFALAPITPNPVGAVGRFAFVVPRTAPVRLSVLDVQGRTVTTLADRVCAPGRHESVWNASTGRGAARHGLYFLRLEAPGVSLTRRFAVTR
jgi:parallel beta-helix repeat protein